MIEIIEELKQVMEDKDLTIEATGRFLDCSWRSVYRWTRKGLIPSSISKRRIREGLAKIYEAYPEKESRLDLSKKTKEFYLRIENKLTEEEKEKVQELHLLKGPESSFKMLQELEKKHKPDKRQIQMFNPGKKGDE